MSRLGDHIRFPTSNDELYAWHKIALEDVALHLIPEVTQEPQCGVFKRRLVKGGPFVPCKIWMFQPTQDGELVGDETFQCEVNGQYADAEDQWLWLCQNPITEAEYNYMVASLAWAAENAPDEPMANPRDKVDWTKVPVPQFEKEQSQ